MHSPPLLSRGPVRRCLPPLGRGREVLRTHLPSSPWAVPSHMVMEGCSFKVFVSSERGVRTYAPLTSLTPNSKCITLPTGPRGPFFFFLKVVYFPIFPIFFVKLLYLTTLCSRQYVLKNYDVNYFHDVNYLLYFVWDMTAGIPHTLGSQDCHYAMKPQR